MARSRGDRGRDRTDFRLQLGPTSSWPAAGIYGEEVDDGVWYETLEENDTFGAYPAPGRDIDGDGFADMVQSGNRGVTLMFGRADVEGSHDPLLEPWLSWNDPLYSAPQAYIGPDLDGDGARELLLSGAGGGTYLAWLDGDGASDLLAGVWTTLHDEDDPVCLAWLSSSVIVAASSAEDTVLARACWYDEPDEAAAYRGYGDIDADGVLDPIFAAYDQQLAWDKGWGKVGCVLGTSRLEIGGTLDASSASLCYYGVGATIPDVNGDGHDDYLGYNHEWLETDTENLGRVDILLGFDIPWDDPTKR